MGDQSDSGLTGIQDIRLIHPAITYTLRSYIGFRWIYQKQIQ